MKNFTRETMDKLARHIERTTTLEVYRFDKATLGTYKSGNVIDPWIHTLYDGISVTCEDKKLSLIALNNCIYFVRAIPNKGYEAITMIESRGYTQAEMFTRVVMWLDRVLNR